MKLLGGRLLRLPYVKLRYNISGQPLGLRAQTLENHICPTRQGKSSLLHRPLTFYFQGFHRLITKVRRCRQRRSKKYIFRLSGHEQTLAIVVHSYCPIDLGPQKN